VETNAGLVCQARRGLRFHAGEQFRGLGEQGESDRFRRFPSLIAGAVGEAPCFSNSGRWNSLPTCYRLRKNFREDFPPQRSVVPHRLEGCLRSSARYAGRVRFHMECGSFEQGGPLPSERPV
jgi:hypothetical protein